MIPDDKKEALRKFFPRPPDVPLPNVQKFIEDHYKLAHQSVQLVRLDGERDENYRLEVDDRGVIRKYVVKICGPEDNSFLLAVDHAQALLHIARMKHLPVPKHYSRFGGGGAMFETLSFDGVEHPVLVLDWLEGEPVGERQLSFRQYQEIGFTLGDINRTLRGFKGPAITGRRLVWHTGELLSYGYFTDWQKLFDPQSVELIRLVEQQHETLPLHALPAQIIHGDVHVYNTLLSEAGAVSGIIDFGDMIHAPRVIDISNAIADFLFPDSDVEKIIHGLLSGFVKATPLEEAEVEVIAPLIQSRLALTTVVTAFRRELGATITPQIAALDDIGMTVLGQLRNRQLDDTIRHAANVMPRRTTVAGNMYERRLRAMGSKPLLFYDPPLHIVKGDGVWLTAADGRRYLDCYNNVPHVGHCHPLVAEAVSRQLRELNTNTRYLTDTAVEYAEQLSASLHESLDTVIFVNSGSEANDVAIRMAKSWTGHTGALCMDFAYHGVTETTDAISPSNYPAGKWAQPHVRLLEAPDGYRGPIRHGTPNFTERYAAHADTALADLADTGHGCAISIVDSAFMTNGILNVPAGYLAAIVEKTHTAGGMFIADEVQSGFGRMGSAMWGHQHHGVVPDFVTIGKPAGNGFPLGAIITRSEILARFTEVTGPFFSTFGGNNAACAAGLAVLHVIKAENLVARANATGAELRVGLTSLMEKHEMIGEVRGVGLATGVEFVRNRQTLEPATVETKRLLNLIRDEGVLVGSDGKHGNVLKIRPPLVFSGEHVTHVVEAIDRALTRLVEGNH